MTTGAKRKSPGVRIQSTDRGGAVTLPLGVALIILGFMLLLGVLLQTSSSSLNLFKNMAIGLGGGLYMAVPFAFIWFGSLLCISAKRYVSMYAFLISFLLMLSFGALLALVLKVNDREYPNLMAYIKNLNYLRMSSNPESMGEYLAASYNRYYGHFAGNNFIPGGGALGMLLAWPLYSALGNTAAITVLCILIAILIPALLRLNPIKIIQHISDILSKRRTRPGSTVVENQPVRQASDPASQQGMSQEYPNDDEFSGSYQQTQPVWPSQAAVSSVLPENFPEPGFIAQPPAGILDEPQTDYIKRNADPVLHQKTVYKKPFPQKSRAPETESVFRQAQPKTTQAQGQAKSEPSPLIRTKAEPAKAQQKPDEITQADPLPRETQKIERAADTSDIFRKSAVNDKKTLLEEGIQPAVPLSGERISVTRREEPASKNTLDGMVRPADVKQIKLAIDDYETPPVRLLTEPPQSEQPDTTAEDLARADKLIETLKSFSVPAYVHDITHGPTVTRFAIRLAEGVNVSRLRSVMDNLTIELKAKGEIRVEMPIPGTSFVGLEVSNDKTTKVYLRDVLSSTRMQETKSPTAVALGKDITGTPIVCELMDMPHLLIAGATGSGKSVCINSIICSMLYRASPRYVRMIMIDPKFVELQPYNDVPHLLMPVITDSKKAAAALDWVCQMMDERYQILVDAGVRNLDAYNRKLGPDEDPLPRIIVIVDEMTDLMTTSGKLVEDHIKRITAKARAAGICLIMATQRPSVNIITGVIKANIPGRIAFRVSSPFDSKTILDEVGAEKLLGYGDMLYRSTTREPIRIQGCFVTDKDVEQTVLYIRSRNKAEYNLDLMEHIEKAEQPDMNGAEDNPEGGDTEFDELLPQAIEMAVEAGQMSISMLQRVLRVGYARSGRLIDEMARRGIISGNEGTKPRKTLMTREQYLTYFEQNESAQHH